ncbi:transcription factor RelB homolog isoform X1 [Haliaeetus albicilla]|uniref:transcription factor RelB homolog isoform X1 n=1 Tax=Haliaeetus albicilla TaxID=8969 RepID=UPI0037E91B6F
MALPLGAALQDPGLAMAHAAPVTEIIEEVMKEDGFQPDPAPVLPKALPKGSAKLVARGSSPVVATRPLHPAESCLLAAGLAPYGVTVLPADTRSPQLTQSLSTLSLSPKLVPRGTTGASGRHRWSPVAGHSKEQLEELLELPKLVITEQPKQRGMRFRYECEGRSAGSILGESSTDASKTLPAIELLNCHTIPEVKVTACLVWKDWPYRVHPHGLVGKDCSNGLCEVVLKPQTNPKHSFSNLGIQCVKKKEIEAAIEKKLQLGIDPFKAGSLKNHQEVDMNVVRICFQASYKDSSGQTQHLSPVLSEPIFDKKSTNTSELRICRMNKESGPCTGGEELYLLCDKVQKEDIAVVFRKETWEARADFSQADVHRQVAIVFKTPPYQHLELAEPVEVEVFLQRLTDSVCSESFRFTYLPKDHDAYGVNVKRKRGMPDVLEELSSTDPYGIEAKRRKKPLGYTDHFAPLPVAEDAFALFTAEPEPFDALAQLYVPFTPPALREGLPPPYPPTDFPACLGPELLAEPYSSPPPAPHFPPTDPHPTASLVGTHMFPGHYKEADLRLGHV